MKKIVLSFINPVNWIKAYSFHRKNARFDKSEYDLELYLYSNILKTDMLHWGYFEDVDVQPENISLQQFEDAQIHYSEKIIEHITDTAHPVLDVGCGIGGLSNLMLNKNLIVEALTPNRNQQEYIRSKYKDLKCHDCKFEDIDTNKKFGTIINSESLQYISLDTAFEKVDEIMLPHGRWIIVDYFRMHDQGAHKSAHLLEDFQKNIAKFGWKVVYQQDITANVLPTIRFVHMFVERFLIPIKHFGFEKLRYKKGWLYFLTSDLRHSLEKKMKKEIASVDPEQFVDEKKYLFFVLEKQ